MHSNSQIDKLGERLRRGVATLQDIELLESYRTTFISAHDAVRARIESTLGLPVSSRSTKTKASIVAKLRRSRTRLSRMQDIAGMRMVMRNREERRIVAEEVEKLFQSAKVSKICGEKTGYRATHIIVPIVTRIDDSEVIRHVEVQLRTLGEHLWAQCSEAIADRYGVEVKYGDGDSRLQAALQVVAKILAQLECSGSPLNQNYALEQRFLANFGILSTAMKVGAYDNSAVAGLFKALSHYAKHVNVLDEPFDENTVW